MESCEEKIMQLVRFAESMRDPDVLRFSRHLIDAGARLFARFPDGREIELHITCECFRLKNIIHTISL